MTLCAPEGAAAALTAVQAEGWLPSGHPSAYHSDWQSEGHRNAAVHIPRQFTYQSGLWLKSAEEGWMYTGWPSANVR